MQFIKEEVNPKEEDLPQKQVNKTPKIKTLKAKSKKY